MNLLNETTTKETDAYELSTAESTLNDLISEANFESGKIDDESISDEIIDDDFEPEEESPTEQKLKSTASLFVVETADEVLTRLIGAYAHCNEDQISKLKGNERQLRKIAEHFKSYFGADNFNLPPWVMGAIAAGVLLFDKFTIAAEMRKVNLALEAEKEKTAELERETRALKVEIDVMKMERERDKLKKQLSEEKSDE